MIVPMLFLMPAIFLDFAILSTSAGRPGEKRRM
jgi:hypothetical protein